MRRFPLVGPVGSFTWRMLATVMAGESIGIALGALVARALASAEGSAQASTWLWTGLGISALALLSAGMMRGRFGVTLGWLTHALALLSSLVVPLMLPVGVIFLGLWIACLIQGGSVDAARARVGRLEA